MSCDPKTKEFAARQRDRGRSNAEIIRILKRAIAREMFTHLTRPAPALDIADLRDLRRAKNITQDAAARALAVPQITISRTERGLYIDTDLATRYRNWLNVA